MMQAEAQSLIQVLKKLLQQRTLILPRSGNYAQFESANCRIVRGIHQRPSNCHGSHRIGHCLQAAYDDSGHAENDIRNTPSIMMMGQSGLSHRFDFVIPASRKMPERIVTALNTPSKQNVQAAIFAWNDVIKTRSAHSKGYIVLNDTKKSANPEILRQYRTNELVRWRMHFLSDAIAEIEGLLDVNRDFCKKQMAKKASSALPTNCAVLP